MSTEREKQPQVERLRRVGPDGLIQEWDPLMGWVTTISADPQPRKLDISADAPGWERLRTLLGRLRR